MATPHGRGLPEEIIIWEILVLPWRYATSVREFLLSHHAREPSLPIVLSSIRGNEISEKLATLDHRVAPPDAQLHPIARRDNICLEASCDGHLILSKYDFGAEGCLFVYNPTTRQHSPIRQLLGFNIVGMYPYRPTGEYRLLLQPKRYRDSPQDQIGCYVFALGSDQRPRYIGWPGKVPEWFIVPVRVRDSLHWYTMYHSKQTEAVMVFDTMSESFRQMRAPIVPTNSYLFEMDETLGLYSCNKALEIINIWVLETYESEVWDLKYQVALPIVEIREKFKDHDDYWYANVALGNGDVLLLVSFNHWLFYVDTDAKLAASFQGFFASRFRHKQTLVSHSFYTALDVNHASTLKLSFI